MLIEKLSSINNINMCMSLPFQKKGLTTFMIFKNKIELLISCQLISFLIYILEW